ARVYRPSSGSAGRQRAETRLAGLGDARQGECDENDKVAGGEAWDGAREPEEGASRGRQGGGGDGGGGGREERDAGDREGVQGSKAGPGIRRAMQAGYLVLRGRPEDTDRFPGPQELARQSL